jgi:hypothetical protein
MVDQPLIDAVQWAVNLSFWSSLVFLVFTTAIWPWWKDWWGQSMMAFDLCISGAVFPSLLSVDWSVHGTGRLWVTVVFLLLVPVVIGWRTVMIFRAQRLPGKTDKVTEADSLPVTEE